MAAFQSIAQRTDAVVGGQLLARDGGGCAEADNQRHAFGAAATTAFLMTASDER